MRVHGRTKGPSDADYFTILQFRAGRGGGGFYCCSLLISLPLTGSNINQVVWNNGKCITGVFCDLTKTFECVNNKLLFKKLEFYGVRSVLLNWFRSYLDDSNQRFYLHILQFNLKLA